MCANLHQNRFIRLRNVVFTSLVTDEGQTHRQTYRKDQNGVVQRHTLFTKSRILTMTLILNNVVKVIHK